MSILAGRRQTSRAAFDDLSVTNAAPLLLAADERSLRQPTFVEGTRIPLADGQTWSLPWRWSDQADPEYDAMLRAILEAEDESDRLRAELALTLFLLARNYRLTPDIYRRLLDFRPRSPLLEQMQRAVRAFTVEQMRSLPLTEARPCDEAPAGTVSLRRKMLARLAWLRAVAAPKPPSRYRD
jgi:hypothetical protein